MEKELGGISAGGLTHTHQRIQKKVKEDKKLSRRVDRIYQEVRAHGQTLTSADRKTSRSL